MSDATDVTAPPAVAPATEPATKRRRIKAGDKGLNRVGVERRRGVVYLGFKDAEGRKRLKRCHSTSAREIEQAAKALAQQLARAPRPPAPRHDEVSIAPITVGQLFDQYRQKLLPTKQAAEQLYQAAVLGMFEKHVGRELVAVEVDKAHWESYMLARATVDPEPDLGAFDDDTRAALAAVTELAMPYLFPDSFHDWGRGWRMPQPVGSRSIQREGKVLRQVYAYGHARFRPDGSRWLPVNPFAAFKLPKVIPSEVALLDAKDYPLLLQAAGEVHLELPDLLIALNETGHRGSAVCGLQWGDVTLTEAGMVRWRADLDKMGHEHTTPASELLLGMLRERAQRLGPVRPEQPIFPSPKDPAVPMRADYARGLLVEALSRAGLSRPARFGLHVFRRKLATDSMDQPLKVVMLLGGWKDMRSAAWYQQVSAARARAALNGRSA